ncbi:MAG: HlyD family efflux transporter periplasmic adaptor subunit [Bacteroidia bacterium]|jgi:multidrug resistance efflux pump|nr:HlyD family efflux transporter periplasmic adaptor subunit [Bacteroidia bacterium]
MGGLNMKTRSKKIPQYWLKDSVWVGRTMVIRLRILLVVVLLGLFLPWRQNIQATGKVITLLPDQRPQEVQTNIAGRVSLWKIKEGDFIKKGDTVVVLTEIKTEYLDPELLEQTEIQINAKEKSVLSYSSKINAINDQINQLENNRDLSQSKAANKIEQEQDKLKEIQADLSAAITGVNIAKKQYERDSILAIDMLRSPLEVENRRLKYQDAIAKKQGLEAKVRIAQNAVETAKIEYRNVRSEYGEKLAKAESDRYTAISAELETEAEVSKLRNNYNNYNIRNGFYVITAPQDGYVSKTNIMGLNETVKEGQSICTIVPDGASLAVELKISPNDMPLIDVGESVNFVFDGWPTIVFSGWPAASFGTFQGKVYGVDNMMDTDGKYRVLVKADTQKKAWPTALKIGVGARGYMLLKTVPIWYELWRVLNGFPADFYKPEPSTETKKSK